VALSGLRASSRNLEVIMSERFAQGYALLVGVGQSTYAPWSLPVTVKDAEAIQAVLIDPTLCAYPAEHVRLLHDEGATRASILKGLEWLAKQVAGDRRATAVVYFSGHGWLKKRLNHYFLIPHDIDPYDIPASGLSAEAFTSALRKVKAERLLTIVDCCHAEGMATAKKGPAAIKFPSGLAPASPPKAVVDELKHGAGRAIFTSSRGQQSSWVRPDDTMSVYTFHLIEALQGANNRAGEKTVKISNLMNYLGDAVPKSARRFWSAEQRPFFDTAAEDFAVALIRGGKGLPGGGWPSVEQEAHRTIGRIVQAIGERAVAIGGDARGNIIITGDQNRVGRERDLETVRIRTSGRRPKKGAQAGAKTLELDAEDAEPAADAGLPRVYRVWYGTNRRHADPSDPSAGYSGKREGKDHVHFGRCLVSIPKSHRFGSVGSAWWKRWLTGTDDRLRIVERAEIARERFWAALKREIGEGRPDDQQILVYLHGYNVTFDAAAVRAAQIGFDLKVPGATAFFSWPSRGILSGYAADEASIEASEAAITEFLVSMATFSGASRVHVIAHSMGNRGLLRAVQRMASRAASASGVRFGQVFLAAPDLDAGLFRELAALYPRVSDRTTLYVSARDRALEASHWLHEFDRAGYVPPVTTVDGIDTVEVTGLDMSVLGHGYFAEAHGVLYDMHQLLRENAAPGARLRTRARRTPEGRRFWAIT
jgi:esterase/lipase superfamily enzyme